MCADMTQPQRSGSSSFPPEQSVTELISDANGQPVMKSDGIASLLPGAGSAMASGGEAPDPGRKRCILLVEDDPDTRACMSSLLELEGYLVVTAADGREALERLRAGLNPGLIILDLMMPGMDGFEFRQEQLRDPGLSSIPVVVASGRFDAQASSAGLEPAACIQKPINFDRFLDMVRTHCRPLPAAATAPGYA